MSKYENSQNVPEQMTQIKKYGTFTQWNVILLCKMKTCICLNATGLGDYQDE